MPLVFGLLLHGGAPWEAPVPFLRFQDVWMSIVKADRDVDCHVARTCLRSFWQLTKETDGIGSIHDVFSRASLSSKFPKDVERLRLHPRLFPMWLRDSFGAAVFFIFFSLSLSDCDTLPS